MTDSNSSASHPTVGFLGLGDQGLPMATAIAEAGFELHVWARRTASLERLGDAPHIAQPSPETLAAATDIVSLCVATDDDVLTLTKQMLPSLRPGTVLINHGTGTPGNAQRLTELFANRGVDVLDAPVSGGRTAAEERRLTTLVGGSEDALRRVEPVLRSFATNIVHLGGSGAGQLAKLFNNALLMMNQASIADTLELAVSAGADAVRLVEALKLGSANSAALGLFNTMITVDTVEHLSEVQAIDMAIFDQALRETGADPTETTARGLSGASRLRQVIDQLNPHERSQ